MFVISENMSEYDDQYYYVQDGVNPLLLANTKKEAQDKIVEFDVKFIKTNEIQYYYMYSENEELQDWIKNHGLDPEKPDFSKLPDEKIREMIYNFKLQFHSYKEISII